MDHNMAAATWRYIYGLVLEMDCEVIQRVDPHIGVITSGN